MFTALAALRSGSHITRGISEPLLKKFESDLNLQAAVAMAVAKYAEISSGPLANFLKMDEQACLSKVQEGYLNFYGSYATNPYIPIGAKGPWVITSHGAVVYDSGGYGMLGFGHNPDSICEALAAPQAMANIMTPSFSQRNFLELLWKEVGHSRGKFPFENVVCLNSGSESNTLACRIADVHAKRMTAPGAQYAGRRPALLSLKGSFHGRTEGPARASDSCQKAYLDNLASYKDYALPTILPNDIDDLRRMFKKLDDSNVYVEMLLLEPVQGEGNPGVALKREFYDEAYRLTRQHGSFLLVDSIQAGIRTTGCLSFLDSKGFEDAATPDFETWSKAINGGQYPLSVLGLGPGINQYYVRGLYGNTMTTNPRALDIACSTLSLLTTPLRRNIVDSGNRFKEALVALSKRHPTVIENVTGTGLLLAAHLSPNYPVLGAGSVEDTCRRNGLGVIHGGKNALRFTPWFQLDDAQIELMISILDESICQFQRVNNLSG